MDYIRYSTTQGTNAVVQRKGPRLGLVVRKGADPDALLRNGEERELFGVMVGARVASIDAALKGTSFRDSDLLTGYVTVEDAFSHNLRLFVRREDSSHLSEAPYLRLFPRFPTARSTLAVRWDFLRRHALTAELTDTYTATNHYIEYRLQWSGALL